VCGLFNHSGAASVEVAADSVRVGFKRNALRAFKGDPQVGDLVRAFVDDDGVSIAVTPLPEAAVGPR
jgi:hypothetical protein